MVINMSRWNRSDILALIGVITGSVGLIGAVATQEIRCKVGLQQNPCPLTEPEIKKVASSFTQANTNYKQGNYRKAINALNKIIELDPTHADTYYLLGTIYSNYYPNKTEAINNLKKAADLFFDQEKHNDGFRSRGTALSLEGNYKEAIQDLNEAIRLNHKDFKAYSNRGFARIKLGDYEGAIEDFSQAISIDPNYDIAYSNRGFAYFNLGNYEKAIEDSNRAIRIDPNDPNTVYAYFNLGVAYKQIGNEQKAIENFQEVLNQKGNGKLHQMALNHLKTLSMIF